jgi:hypothetical protein
MVATVTAADLTALGINPACPMASVRHKNWPIDVRFGNDRIRRAASGQMAHSFGYYSKSQVRARQAWAKEISEACNGGYFNTFFDAVLKLKPTEDKKV